MDALAEKRLWLSPYNYCRLNPINRIDPTGALVGEYEKDDDGNWNKVSTKGDEIGVDFYHTDGVNDKGDKTQTTFITDRKGNWNAMSNGRYALQGEQRGDEVNRETIYNEWKNGTGSERSVFEGNHPANIAIKDNYLFQNAYEDFQKSGLSKKAVEVNILYGIDILRKGGNMQVQNG